MNKYKILSSDSWSSTDKFLIDTESDLSVLPKSVGSIALVADTSEEYILNNKKEWTKIKKNDSSNSGNNSENFAILDANGKLDPDVLPAGIGGSDILVVNVSPRTADKTCGEIMEAFQEGKHVVFSVFNGNLLYNLVSAALNVSVDKYVFQAGTATCSFNDGAGTTGGQMIYVGEGENGYPSPYNPDPDHIVIFVGLFTGTWMQLGTNWTASDIINAINDGKSVKIFLKEPEDYAGVQCLHECSIYRAGSDGDGGLTVQCMSFIPEYSNSTWSTGVYCNFYIQNDGSIYTSRMPSYE